MQTNPRCTRKGNPKQNYLCHFSQGFTGGVLWNCCQASREALRDGGCPRDVLQQSISPAKLDHFVGCGIWLWAFWENEACNELSSLHDHKRHNPAKGIVGGCKIHRGLYQVLCFFIGGFQSGSEIQSLLWKILVGFKSWFPDEEIKHCKV